MGIETKDLLTVDTSGASAEDLSRLVACFGPAVEEGLPRTLAIVNLKVLQVTDTGEEGAPSVSPRTFMNLVVSFPGEQTVTAPFDAERLAALQLSLPSS
ncbi:MAG: hypothetical protein WC777_05010 [Candidatus Gracilibacteria bacterium]|jgi:hypothetical protein